MLPDGTFRPDAASDPATSRADRISDRRFQVEHFPDPFGGGIRARGGREDVHGHHDGHQDLQDVGDQGGECAHPHLAGLDPVASEPHHRYGGDIDHQHDRRQHAGDEQRGLQVVAGELLVDGVEPAGLVLFAAETPDDVGADDLFPQHPAGPVDKALAVPVERDEAAHDHDHDAGEDRHDGDHDEGERAVLVQGEGDTSSEDGRCGDQHGEHQDREVLDLGHIVRGPGDKARGSEDPDLLRGHGLHFGEQFGPQLPSDLHGHRGAQVAGGNGRHYLNRCNPGHPRTEKGDHGGVAGHDPVVDDGRVQGRQQQVRRGLHQLQEDDGQHGHLVGGQEPPHQTEKHRTSIVRPGLGQGTSSTAGPARRFAIVSRVTPLSLSHSFPSARVSRHGRGRRSPRGRPGASFRTPIEGVRPARRGHLRPCAGSRTTGTKLENDETR